MTARGVAAAAPCSGCVTGVAALLLLRLVVSGCVTGVAAFLLLRLALAVLLALQRCCCCALQWLCYWRCGVAAAAPCIGCVMVLRRRCCCDMGGVRKQKVTISRLHF